METRPADLPDALVSQAITAGWALPSPTVAYLPVGFGSHHWTVVDGEGDRWFASVDVAPDGSGEHAGLEAALTTAAVAQEAGLAFVVAPTRTTAGHVHQRLDRTYALALYPHIDGQGGSFHDQLDLTTARRVVAALAVLHTATPDLLGRGARPRVDDLQVPGRAGLLSALEDASAPDPGTWREPYGARLRALLRAHAATLRTALHALDDALDDALDEAGEQHDRLVVTHGEPHPGNVIHTPDGPVLVDWDTTALAPPERDLWHVVTRLAHEEAREVSAHYAERSGRTLQPALLERYRLAWALADVADFTAVLGLASAETADTATAWEALVGTLEELAARHTSPNEGSFVGQEVTTRTPPAGP